MFPPTIPQTVPQQPPLNSVTGIESLVLFGLQVFISVFTAFRNQNIPTSVSPQIIATMQATPGNTPEHNTVIAAAVNTAANAHTATQS